MKNSNIFFGESCKAQFANIIYKHLMKREWFTNTDVMVEYLDKKSANDLPYSVTKCENYTQLKKAFNELKTALTDRIGAGCIEEKGNNRDKSFRYTGSNPDPLRDMRNAMVIKNINKYWQFCQDSAGFFPTSWLEYFFQDCEDLLEIKKNKREGKQILASSLDRMLTNIYFLPFLYEAIIKKQVLSIDYKPYDEEERNLTFHPHFLKEFNGRWHLLGHADGQTPENGYNIALDRICSRPRELYKIAFKPAPKGFYNEYFKNIVGVTHTKDKEGNPYHAEAVHIRAHSHYIFKLTDTKRIHPSQEVSIPFGEHEDGKYGEFVIHVELNNEFIGRILQMGDGLEVVSPENIRKIFADRIENMHRLYAKGTESTDKDS